MCRYAFKKYKMQYVCFDCRKVFKQKSIEDLAMANGDWNNYQKAYLDSQNSKKFGKENPELFAYLEKTYINRICRCPQCSKEMSFVGQDFKAPKKENIKEWKILEGLFETGFIFQSCGCDAYGFIPKDKNQYKSHLTEQRNYYEEKLLERSDLMPQDLTEYLNYWSAKIVKTDVELEKLD